MGDFCLYWDRRVERWQERIGWRERGAETARRESNSGRCERSCAACRHANHEAIGANIKHIFCMTIFYIPNPIQYLNLTTTLLTINKQQIRSLLSLRSLFFILLFSFLNFFPPLLNFLTHPKVGEESLAAVTLERSPMCCNGRRYDPGVRLEA